MKTVWILNHYAQIAAGPCGIWHYSLAYHLSRYGWHAYILAASVELNTDRQKLGIDEKHLKAAKMAFQSFQYLAREHPGGVLDDSLGLYGRKNTL